MKLSDQCCDSLEWEWFSNDLEAGIWCKNCGRFASRTQVVAILNKVAQLEGEQGTLVVGDGLRVGVHFVENLMQENAALKQQLIYIGELTEIAGVDEPMSIEECVAELKREWARHYRSLAGDLAFAYDAKRGQWREYVPEIMADVIDALLTKETK